MEAFKATSHVNIDAMSSKIDAIQASVMGLWNLGAQIAVFVRTFAFEIWNTLHTLMHRAVLQLQEQLALSPTSLHSLNMKSTKVLGEYRELPYEY